MARTLSAISAALLLASFAPDARSEGTPVVPSVEGIQPIESVEAAPAAAASAIGTATQGALEAAETPAELDAVPTPPQLDATAIGEAWFAQMYGFDALESHDLGGFEVPVTVGVARKWQGDRVVSLVYIVEPPQMDEVGWLWERELGRGDEVLMYFTPQLTNFIGEVAGLRARKVGRLPTGLPVLTSGGIDAMILESFRPHLPGELLYQRLPDEEIEGEPCYVVEGRPTAIDLGFDRIRLAISKVSGVALRTWYYEGELEMRRLETSPADVKEYEGRYLAQKRTIHTADGTTATLTKRDHILDRELRDRLFSRLTLRVGRFPRFDWQSEVQEGIDWRR